MERMPLSSFLLAAAALWGLWLWRRHRLTPAGAGGPTGAIPGAVPAPLGTLNPPTATDGGPR